MKLLSIFLIAACMESKAQVNLPVRPDTIRAKDVKYIPTTVTFRMNSLTVKEEIEDSIYFGNSAYDKWKRLHKPRFFLIGYAGADQQNHSVAGGDNWDGFELPSAQELQTIISIKHNLKTVFILSFSEFANYQDYKKFFSE